MHIRIPSIAAFAVATILCTTVADANSLKTNSPSALEETLRTFSGQFDVEYVHNRLTLNDRTDGPLGIPDRSLEEVEGMRSAIRDNDALMNSLKQKGIAVGNLINAYQAADGSMTFYVR